MVKEPEEAADYRPQLTRIGGGQNYLPVAERVEWVSNTTRRGMETATGYTIDTEAVQLNADLAIFRAVATLYGDGGVILRRASATGTETPKDFRDYIEKAETKAVGRALSYLGFGTAAVDEGGVIADAPRPPRTAPTKTAADTALRPVQPEAEGAPEPAVEIDLRGLHGDIARAYQRAFGVDDIDAHAAARRLAKLWYGLDSLKALTPRGLGIFRAKVRGLSDEELLEHDAAALDLARNPPQATLVEVVPLDADPDRWTN